MPSAQDSPQLPVTGITRVQLTGKTSDKKGDVLAVEEPLEITLCSPQQQRFTLAITMRTPGNDRELVAGFLFAEGMIKNKNDIAALAPDPDANNPGNNMSVTLSHTPDVEPGYLQRHFFTNSSCGVCGKTAIQAIELQHQPELSTNKPVVTTNTLLKLPETLRKHQPQFSATGSVHSAALFTTDGTLLRVREDVGRHNAMDKLIGSLLLDDQLHIARESLLLVSGRASFELVQKALMANIAMLVAIGAPTSLAFQLANRHGMTLAGFLKPDSFNIYCAAERII